MGLKILHSADWHLDAPFTSFPEAQRRQLRQAQRALPDRIVGICREEMCDMLLLSGDIFDGQPTPATVDRVKAALAAAAVPVIITPGNHDPFVPGSPWEEASWPENVRIFTGGLEALVIPELSCRVYGAGYRSMDCPALLADFRAEGQEKYVIGVLHGDPVYTGSPCCPVTAAQVRESGLDYLALGHIHKPGQFLAGDTLCAWPGSPMGRGWDETGPRSVILAELGAKTRIHRVPTGLPAFYELEAPAAELEARLPAAGSEDFYRVTLTGTEKPDPAALEGQLRRFPNLILLDRTCPAADLWALAGEDSLLGTYFRLLREQAEMDSTARLAAEISLALLEGREVDLP